MDIIGDLKIQEKVAQRDAVKSDPRIFITYPWDGETDADIREAVDYLKSKEIFDIWFDTDVMKWEGKEKEIADFVETADLVIVFFNNYYQLRDDCKKEAELADKYKHPWLFVNVQKKGRLKIQHWFDAVLLDNTPIQFYKTMKVHDVIFKQVVSQLGVSGESKKKKAVVDDTMQGNFFHAVWRGSMDALMDVITSQTEERIIDASYRVDLHRHERVGGNKVWNGETSLMIAARRGHLKIVEFLLSEMHVNVNDQDDRYGETALMKAVQHRHTKIVQFLVKWPGVKINMKDNENQTAFMWAAKYGLRDILEIFLKQPGILINEKDKIGRTAVILAAIEGRRDIVEFLLKVPGLRSKDPKDPKHKGGWTTLLYPKGPQKNVEEMMKNHVTVKLEAKRPRSRVQVVDYY